MQEIQSAKPQYKISYIDCSQKSHQGQKMNLICLQQVCKQQSLICSLCKQSKHNDHHTKPLKFYLQQLKKKYQGNVSNFESQLQDLQRSKALFMIKMTQSVQKIAQQFRQLQRQVIDRFQLVKSQMIQNQNRRKNFQEFYHNITSQRQEFPQFSMSNYLPQKAIDKITDINSINELTKSACGAIQRARFQLLKERLQQIAPSKNSNHHLNLNLNADDLYNKPTNITKQGFVFTQTSIINNLAPCLCILNQNVTNLLGKIKIKVLQLRKASKIALGIVQKTYGKQLKQNWNYPINDNAMWICSDGTKNKTISNTINSFNQFVQLQVFYSSNIIKIITKKSSCTFELDKNKQYNFCFVLQGKSKIQLVYPAL